MSERHSYGCECDGCYEGAGIRRIIERLHCELAIRESPEVSRAAAIDAENLRTAALEAAAACPPDEQVRAERDRALDVVESLLRDFGRLGSEYSTVNEQRSLRAARGLLVEMGRKVP